MPRCGNCGNENAEGDRFCSGCGVVLVAERELPGELRKTVTVVYADMAGSTALAEKLDPESLRRLMSRYYEEIRLALERHGGTVAKFIGDAVLAVFGVPISREDDALRAVRAAVDMQASLNTLNLELEERWGVRLQIRTGVNTGEVVVDEVSAGQGFVVGDAVNVAARLEQAANEGEILIGASTYGLVRDAVTAERKDPVTLKGKEGPVAPFRLLEILAGAPPFARRLDSPLIGRERELESLRAAFAGALDETSCRKVTVIGAAGIGKSRLTQDFLDGVGKQARVVRGRCLPYGDGITFWPIAELVKEAAGIHEDDSPDQAREKIAGLLPADADLASIVEPVTAAVGLSASYSNPEETFWAIRRLLEALARERPLVVVFDDIHCGEPTFLDLVEYLGGFAREVSLLMILMARPELLERRPRWMSAAQNAVLLKLDSLDQQAMQALIENLLSAQLDDDVERRIVETAEGNPLFVEQMLRMLIDEGRLERANGRWTAAEEVSSIAVPPTIHALLAARLDGLEWEERAVMERAAVIGKEFWSGAVAELSPAEVRPSIWRHLQTLVQKDLVRVGGIPFTGEAAFTFSHLLVRDTAYREMLKETRAELHERFARWLELKVGDRVAEYEEIVAYHLEQAYAYRRTLGHVGERERRLAGEAGRHLGSAGVRAYARGDMQTVKTLLQRSLSLWPDEGSERLERELLLGDALFDLGELPRAEKLFGKVADTASALGDRRLELRALLACSDLRTWTSPEGSLSELRDVAERGIALFGELGDKVGLSKAWRNLGTAQVFQCRWDEAGESLEQAFLHAHDAGHHQVATQTLVGLATALCLGPVRVEEAIGRVEELIAQVAGGFDAKPPRLVDRTILEAWGLAGLEAMRGRFERARELCLRARGIFEELGQSRRLADLSEPFAAVEMLAGNLEAAEKELRSGYESLSGMGEKAVLSTVAAELAATLHAQGRDGEAERFTEESRRLTSSEDVESQIRWRTMKARLEARKGNLEEAESLAREAVERSGEIEYPNLQGDTLAALAAVLAEAGRASDARASALNAMERYEAKGNVVSAAGLRDLLTRLGG